MPTLCHFSLLECLQVKVPNSFSAYKEIVPLAFSAVSVTQSLCYVLSSGCDFSPLSNHIFFVSLLSDSFILARMHSFFHFLCLVNTSLLTSLIINIPYSWQMRSVLFSCAVYLMCNFICIYHIITFSVYVFELL